MDNTKLVQCIKQLFHRNSFLYATIITLHTLFNCLFPIRGKRNVFHIKGLLYKTEKSIIGNNNCVYISQGSVFRKGLIRIRGNNNKLQILENVYIGDGCSFWLEGNNNTIIIHKNTTFTTKVHLNAQEHGTVISIGEDCMFSNTIIVRTSDSHPIFDRNGIRTNPAKSVIIGNHVWIAPSTTIMKGTIIDDNCIIGSHSLVTKNIPANCIAVGMPAKVVREGVYWTRENIII